MIDIQNIISVYNPWWENGMVGMEVPAFHRPIFQTLMEDMRQIPQILSITGPRRVGKSTLLYQIIRQLLNDQTAPKKIIYYSFDDPALDISNVHVNALIEYIMQGALQGKKTGLTYIFLDEIQRLDRWELYLKKYHDLKYPIRVIISGSASSPIFKKSRESLMGRVKDYHLLPFSFREFVLYSLIEKPSLMAEVNNIYEQGKTAQGFATGDLSIVAKEVPISLPSRELQIFLDGEMRRFMLEGGFPEVWSLPTWVAKQDYLYDNQVRKVIYEDLVLAAEFRKPELLKRFYISLLESPGREASLQSVSKEINIKIAQIDKYLPLLEMTDLVYSLSKFRASPLRVRRGAMKFYLVDLALRNAVLRLDPDLLDDNQALGIYAENLTFLALRKWRGTIQMDYYRERNREIDFIVHVKPRQFLPVEVKFQNQISDTDFKSILSFGRNQKRPLMPIMVTKKWHDFGPRNGVFLIPLPLFLLLFD